MEVSLKSPIRVTPGTALRIVVRHRPAGDLKIKRILDSLDDIAVAHELGETSDDKAFLILR